MTIKHISNLLLLLLSFTLLFSLTACGGGGGGNGDINDSTVPTLTAFTLPATSSSMIVAISSLTASPSVTGYCLAESDSSNSCTWNDTAPGDYTFTTAGSKTLYAFARDAAGNISNSLSAPISLIITAKMTIGIQRIDHTQVTNVGSVDFDIILPTAFVLPSNASIPTTMSALVNGLYVQQGVNYTHPTLILSLIKGGGSAFSTGGLVSFTRTLQSGEALPSVNSFQLDLIQVSEISDNGDALIQTEKYEATLTIEEI